MSTGNVFIKTLFCDLSISIIVTVIIFLLATDVPGVRTTTDMVMSEQTTTITSREMAMPFQFLCGGLTSTNSCRHTQKQTL